MKLKKLHLKKVDLVDYFDFFKNVKQACSKWRQFQLIHCC